MAGPTYIKDPDDVLDYEFNWATKDSYLNDGSASDTGWLQGDTITTSTVTVESGLTLDSDSNNTVRAIAWLSGGTDGVDYTVTNRIVTAAARTADRSILVRVRPK